MPRLAALALAAAMLLLGPGCHGTLEIWGVNVPIPGGGGGDDDDAAVFDWSNYDGTEILNIDWTPEEEADGHFDCLAEWRAQGPETSGSDSNLCPECEFVWQVSLVAQPGADECLQQGTGIAAPNQYTRKVGLLRGDGVEFTVFRTSYSVGSPLGNSENDPLQDAGVGAFQGTEYTWSGQDSPVSNDQLGYSFFYSGEGQF